MNDEFYFGEDVDGAIDVAFPVIFAICKS